MPIFESTAFGQYFKNVHAPRVNRYSCSAGDIMKVGTFVEIQKNAVIGRRCKIPSHSFICEGGGGR